MSLLYGMARTVQEAPNRFFLKIIDVALVFRRGADGRVEAVEVIEGARTQRLPRIE